MKLRVAFFVILVCLSAIVFSCRRNQPSLVDANRAPDTELWYAPPDSSEYNYLVHLYWRGLDNDGVAVRYIWTITDTLVDGPLRWNPSQRIRDFRRGRLTTRTDSVFSFTAFRNQGGIGLKKNRQAFHIAAIDDNGVIDPQPAAIEFVATVDKLPGMNFWTRIVQSCEGVQDTVGPTDYDITQIDTVGMYRPFWLSFEGFTTNGRQQQYRYFPLTADVELPGANVWYDVPEGAGRQTVYFPNGFEEGSDVIPSGRLRLAAQVRDDAGAESFVDAAGFTEGVVQVVVNFEPETRIFSVRNRYRIGNTLLVDTLTFNDEKPDTVPMRSWIELNYIGKDCQRIIPPNSEPCPCDSSRCDDDVNECITYQYNFTRRNRFTGGRTTSAWLPEIPEDTNDEGRPDSTSINVGSYTYVMRARAVDEDEKPDGTPAEVEIIGNFDPTLDDAFIESYDGTIVGKTEGVVDTVTWDWWNPSNYNGGPLDTLDFTIPTEPRVVKAFTFRIKGRGHDHPKDPVGSGVKSWRYVFRRADDPTIIQKFARATSWADGQVVNQLNDEFTATFSYQFVNAPVNPFEVEAYNNRPSWLDKAYDFTIVGRDGTASEDFEQFIIVGDAFVRNNVNKVADNARRTAEKGFRFYIRLAR